MGKKDNELTKRQSSNFSALTGTNVSIEGPEAYSGDQKNLLAELPENIVCAKTALLPGAGHIIGKCYIFPEDAAKMLVEYMIKEKSGFPLDEMAASVFSEVIAQFVNCQIDYLIEKTGDRALVLDHPETACFSKDQKTDLAAYLSAGKVFINRYKMSCKDSAADYKFWEIYDNNSPEVKKIIEITMGSDAIVYAKAIAVVKKAEELDPSEKGNAFAMLCGAVCRKPAGEGQCVFNPYVKSLLPKDVASAMPDMICRELKEFMGSR